jgi:imidazolonepropionase-like amidohydrolase
MMAQVLLEEAPTLFLNARLIDGNGGAPVEGAAVRVEGGRIGGVGRTVDWGENPNGNNRVVDLKGKTLMPGLTEGHFHISFWGVRELPDLDLKLPAELSTVYAVKNAELALRCGYTSAASAGALHRVDVTIRDAIEQGVIVGPRLAASGRDICATSGMLDWNPSFWRLGMEGLAIFADGVDGVRRAVRENIKEGCDVIKLYVTGEGLLRGRPGIPPEETMYSLEEIEVAVREAHVRNRQIAAHVRGNDGVKLCVRAGVDVIEHATYADEEAIAMIAERREQVFVVPGLGYHWGILERGLACGISQEMIDASGYQDEWERGCEAMSRLREAGVRVIPGGDYGFVWCPHGEYAKDIELLVTAMGFSPMEALVAATKHGSELMRMSAETGTVEAGKFADLLVVDGDPLEDIAVLQDRSRLAMVMKGGKVMVNTLGLPQELQPLPDFTMEVERIQRLKAGVDPMPSAAEVQH